MSHSSHDRAIVQAFVEAFLPTSALTDRKRVRYISDKPDSPALLKPGTAIWTELREDLENTCCFIASLSERYFKSNWCIAELAVYYELMRADKKRGLPILLIIDPECAKLEHSQFTHGRVSSRIWDTQSLRHVVTHFQNVNVLKDGCGVPDPDSLNNFISGLGGAYVDILKEPCPHKRFRFTVKRLLITGKHSEQGFLTELAHEHFSHAGTSNGPISCIVQRVEYEHIAVNMARCAKWELLWTLFKSPLLVADAYRATDSLMAYDRSFAEFDPIKKIRLVIFDELRAATAYKTLDVGYHTDRFAAAGIDLPLTLTREKLQERKDAFERSARENDGSLYFTTPDLLKRCFRGCSPQPDFHKDSFLEFAWSDYDEGPPLLMESGFTSEFSRAHGDGQHEKLGFQFRHVTFYTKPDKDCSEAIAAVEPYKRLLGHLDDLRTIAESLFRGIPDPKIFVTWDNIDKL